ncbi:MAG: TetM/TetW/TetO/TetS family tetracycline resistance ribosomal protection protein [Lachnospiraceae bacterium]|nr:TetM/TetW/TetO/TetS family tetracycline resistance ribosomal protection protein [Lachnospiraceae bacterium]
MNTVLGILAHVDAGKTTLAEAMLYSAGVMRKIGRVDHGDTVMDTHALEKARGITIFSSEAPLEVSGRRFSLLDTPGHVDFSAEMERTLSVLDAAILVISGTDGVQAHTRTLWRLLSLYAVPTVIFVTKMDYARFTQEELMKMLFEELSESVVNFCADETARDEQAALSDEETLELFMEEGRLPDEKIRALIAGRRIFPVFFGSGLRLEGLEAFLDGLCRFVPERSYPEKFGARVFKISYDDAGSRLLHLKLTGGELHVRDSIPGLPKEEKVAQIRVYTGERYVPVESREAGDLCVVTGLKSVENGAGLGIDSGGGAPVLEPVMRYTIRLPEGVDPMQVMPDFRRLSEEDPALNITWDPWLKEIQAGLMGEVQAEILKSLIRDRFGLTVEIGNGHVLYRETIEDTVEGVGHYEPLRHYAEVHLKLEPMPRGTGLIFRSAVSTDQLDRNFQNLILQHLVEKEHLGVLTGSPITDIRITLTVGRAHLKHTEGGDFREATYRAVRMGLMRAKSRILEPWFRFRLEVPQTAANRAMTDIKRFGGTFLPPVYTGTQMMLTGRAPAAEMNLYQQEVLQYTGGTGHLTLDYDGYDKCHNEEIVRSEAHYEPEADLENSPDSVFCAHGGGFLVKWYDVPKYMHLPETVVQEKTLQMPAGGAGAGSSGSGTGGKSAKDTRRGTLAADQELEEIMLREFGPIRRPQYSSASVIRRASGKESSPDLRKIVLLIDGYNVIFAWEELRELAETDIQAARDALVHIVTDYSAFRATDSILVFDGYRVRENPGEVVIRPYVTIVYTKEKESADLYIEKVMQQLPKDRKAEIVTSDNMIQLAGLRYGAVRVSSGEFYERVKEAKLEIGEILERARRKERSTIGELLTDIELPEKEDEADAGISQ